MFVWAKIPENINLGSIDFSIKLLKNADVAVAPGLGFGDYGEGYVRIALVENKNRIRQAMKNMKRMMDD